MKNTIGQNIAFYRKKAGMTQEELSEQMAVTVQKSGCPMGRSLPPSAMFPKIRTFIR